MSHSIFFILAFSANFCQIEIDLSGIFGIFDELLSTENENVAIFKTMINETFFEIFKHYEIDRNLPYFF